MTLIQQLYLRIDLWVSDIVLKRTEEAFATLKIDPVVTDTESTKARLREKERQFDVENPSSPILVNESILAGTTLKDILLRDFEQPGHAVQLRRDPSHPQRRGMFGDNQLMMSWCARQLRTDAQPMDIEGDPDVSHLNSSQRKAIALMISERVSLIQGVSTRSESADRDYLTSIVIHYSHPEP